MIKKGNYIELDTNNKNIKDESHTITPYVNFWKRLWYVFFPPKPLILEATKSEDVKLNYKERKKGDIIMLSQDGYAIIRLEKIGKNKWREGVNV